MLVAIYAGATIVIDVAPDAFLRAMPGGGEDADPLPGAASRKPGTDPAAAATRERALARWRRKHRK